MPDPSSAVKKEAQPGAAQEETLSQLHLYVGSDELNDKFRRELPPRYLDRILPSGGEAPFLESSSNSVSLVGDFMDFSDLIKACEAAKRATDQQVLITRCLINGESLSFIIDEKE